MEQHSSLWQVYAHFYRTADDEPRDFQGYHLQTIPSAEELLIKELHGEKTVETLASAQEAGEKLMELSQKIGGRLGMPWGW